MTDVSPGVDFSHGEDQGAEKLPCAPGCREASNNDLLPLCGLHLEPVGSSDSGGVGAFSALCHDAFEALALGLGKELLAAAFAVTAEGNEQTHFSFKQRQRAKVFAFRKHKVEDAVEKFCFVAKRILQQLKMGSAILSNSDQLAVDDGVTLDAFESLGDLDVAAADDLTVAAVQRHLAAADFGDHAEPVELVLEDPVGIVERQIREGCEHGLKSLGQLRRSAHSEDDRVWKDASTLGPARWRQDVAGRTSRSRCRPSKRPKRRSARVRTKRNPSQSLANHGIVRIFGFTIAKRRSTTRRLN